MSNYSYDEVYGIPLEEYLQRHNLTLEHIIDKINIDISILKENLGRTMDAKLPYPENHIEYVVFNAIKKKQEHLDRLLAWANEEGYE